MVMAKANDTAMEKLLQWIRLNPDAKHEDIIEKIRLHLVKVERQQIQTAFINGTNGSYTDSQHYYFMEYIDND